jgi:hypothetical protein
MAETLERLIADTAHAMQELAAWPDSPICQQEADKAIKKLQKAWKDQSYPRAFVFMTMVHIAQDVRGSTYYRDSVKEAGLHAAWMKIGELLSC